MTSDAFAFIFNCSSPPYTCLETGTNRIDFGIQINEHQIISKCFEITNSGNLEGSYTLQSNVASHLIVTPSRGIVGPNQSQTISVELLCNFVGKVSECLRYVGFNHYEYSYNSVK